MEKPTRSNTGRQAGQKPAPPSKPGWLLALLLLLPLAFLLAAWLFAGR